MSAGADSGSWDRAYRQGEWDYLRGPGEQARYRVLAGCISVSQPDRALAVLDLGCGTGILRRHLASERVERYMGLDWSLQAVEQARRESPAPADFACGSIDEWESNESYDAIVFNEVLYYLPRPTPSVERYVSRLRPGGASFISMWHPASWESLRRPVSARRTWARLKHGRIWRALAQRYEFSTDVLVRTDPVQTWRIAELRPQ